jgi:membrane-associated protease RseP (regulator of RpoE activity)
LNFGTFGAFIRIQAPIRTKSELFDVGIAGPIAGFVALIPFLIYGLAHSSYAGSGLGGDLTQLGHPLAIELVARLLHGPPPAGAFLNLHPAALGAWLGLLATSINLLPLGQLDGGHVLYAVFGARQRRLARPLWLALALLGFIWPGWWVWCVLLLVIGIRHPPVYDETAPLDRKRKLLGGLALVMLVLSFTPAPVAITRLGEPVPSPPQAPRQRALPAVDSPAGARADLEDQGHRPVVDQGHRHPGAKAPGRDA